MNGGAVHEKSPTPNMPISILGGKGVLVKGGVQASIQPWPTSMNPSFREGLSGSHSHSCTTLAALNLAMLHASSPVVMMVRSPFARTYSAANFLGVERNWRNVRTVTCSMPQSYQSETNLVDTRPECCGVALQNRDRRIFGLHVPN